MTSYAMVESLPFTAAQANFQNTVHSMAAQVVTHDKLYGYDALTHGHQHSNDSGYFTIGTGYGNDKRRIGYDAACARGVVKRDILGRATINVPNCGCTQYKERNCTGTMGKHSCSGNKCPKNNPVCCHTGDQCAPRKIGDSGTCIAGQPYPYDLR